MTHSEEAYAICKFFAAKCGIKVESMFIAGSWVANPFRANDIDIWVYTPECVIFDEEYRNLGNMIYGSTRAEIHAAIDGFDKPASYLEWYGKPVQIIETPFEIFELMDLFDLSCCCYAMGFNGYLCTGSKATHPVDREIQVLKNTASTEHRLAKLNERYGHTTVDTEVPF